MSAPHLIRLVKTFNLQLSSIFRFLLLYCAGSEIVFCLHPLTEVVNKRSSRSCSKLHGKSESTINNLTATSAY